MSGTDLSGTGTRRKSGGAAVTVDTRVFSLAGRAASASPAARAGRRERSVPFDEVDFGVLGHVHLPGSTYVAWVPAGAVFAIATRRPTVDAARALPETA
ncbi:hypothetical protein [Histidinibacterium lentulum]|uniref:Uncharacterized protein n=1 Tax=Histidinibacterium lentulum TaxID=2480588 RepID=A0A3N2R743_9RHOB|nr:hypothetical protein [Histidinibacterium lentulum]ROU03201.1 hypothetical protein EAT49_07900 [Histidinibacterium lentulum]